MLFVHAVLLCVVFSVLFWKVEGLAAGVAGLQSSHESSLGRCVASISEHVEEACAVREPSGGTPDKKTYPHPDRFRYCKVLEVLGCSDVA